MLYFMVILLYCFILYYILLYFILLYYIILYYTILYYIILYYIISYHIILYYIVLYYIRLYYIILDYIILYQIILYYIIIYIYIIIIYYYYYHLICSPTFFCLHLFGARHPGAPHARAGRHRPHQSRQKGRTLVCTTPCLAILYRKTHGKPFIFWGILQFEKTIDNHYIIYICGHYMIIYGHLQDWKNYKTWRINC